VAYLNVDEIESALENLAGAYPAATQLITVPHRTHEGRVSHVLRLGAAASGRDGVLILGGVHAREWVPPDALIALAADLLEAFDLGTGLGYGGKSFAAGDVRQLMHTMNVYVYPSGNRDGRQFSQSSDPQWRKNRPQYRRMYRRGHQPQLRFPVGSPDEIRTGPTGQDIG
jgi:murein tripeptide amidase MpaA